MARQLMVADPLTPRQRDVVALVRRGLSNSEVAGELGITEDGVKAHLSRLFLRYDVSNRVALLAALDGSGHGPLPGPRPLGELRAAARDARDFSDSLDLVTGDRVREKLSAVRDALSALDVALELVRDLPAETTGPVLDALRKRVVAAIASLDAVQTANTAQRSAPTL